MIPIPESLGGITSEWLTAVLRASGLLETGTASVSGVQRVGADSGYASQVGRIRTGFDGCVTSLPDSMIVKLAASGTDVSWSEFIAEKYARECAFYTRVWPDVGVRTPVCYFAAHEAETRRVVLLLEDLGTARFGDAESSWSQDEAESIVDALAGLHAKWWNHPNLDSWRWLPPFGDGTAQLEKLPGRRSVFLDRYREVVSPDLRELTMRLGQQVADRLRRLSAPPRTLLHGDLHLDNVAFPGGETGRPVLFDWQCVAKGLGVVDLALFITMGSPEHRRMGEQKLIRRYHARLAAAGVTGYSLETLMDDYLVALLRCWIGIVNGYGSPNAEAWAARQSRMALQSVRWWNDVAQDHDLAGLIAAS